VGIEFNFKDHEYIQFGDPKLNMEEISGHVYVATNPNFPTRLVKIGATSRSPDVRVEEISGSYGVPGNYAVGYSCKMTNYIKIERKVHRALESKRVPDTSEFFYVLPSVAKNEIKKAYARRTV
jgi:hypothetical protein